MKKITLKNISKKQALKEKELLVVKGGNGGNNEQVRGYKTTFSCLEC